MSFLVTVERGGPLPFRRRAAALVAVGAARVLSHLPPPAHPRCAQHVRRGAAPATYPQALAARDAVVAASVLCAGEGCLERAIATALLCRLRGAWPTWRTGVRTTPFTAHAWVEVDGQPVGEPHDPGYYRPIITIPPAPGARWPRRACQARHPPRPTGAP